MLKQNNILKNYFYADSIFQYCRKVPPVLIWKNKVIKTKLEKWPDSPDVGETYKPDSFSLYTTSCRRHR